MLKNIPRFFRKENADLSNEKRRFLILLASPKVFKEMLNNFELRVSKYNDEVYFKNI